VTKVCLDALQLDDAVEESIRWFSAKKGVDKELTVDSLPGQVEYSMPDDCDMVTDVSFQLSNLDPLRLFSSYANQDDSVSYGALRGEAASSGGLYSSIVQSMQYVEMAKRITSNERNWMYYQHKNTLLLLPDQKNNEKVFVEYKSCGTNIEKLPERDKLLIRRYALAWAKQDLGMIYSKYSTWPTAQGQVSLNGDQLLAQSRYEMEKLEEEIYESAKPMSFFTQ
jgi:hypothetical protein